MLSLIPATLGTASDPNMRQVFSPYWSIAGGYESVVQLHNNLVGQALSVRPVLLSPDGVRLELDEIKIGPNANASLDIRDALAKNHSAMQSGSAVFEYSHPSGSALLAETAVTQPDETMAYTIAATELGASTAGQHAVFWLPSAQAGAYIAVQNTSAATLHISAAFESTGPPAPFISLTLSPNASQVIEMPLANLWKGHGNRSDVFGAVVLAHDGPDSSLNASG
ncbi:MAG: hypothetical protein LAP87_12850 [Acidobacteriia bacterium]|nr:hypothetical protein [Terriglobia bacterium]